MLGGRPTRLVVVAIDDTTPEGLFPFRTVQERDAWLAALPESTQLVSVRAVPEK
jgi:hypothetical protein